MVELLERRVTRNLSNELQAKAAISHAQNHQYQPQAQPPLQVADGNSRSPNRSNSNTLGNTAEADGFSFEPPPLFHTTSEEIFLRTIVEAANAQSSPNMDGLGFSNLPPAFRRNSEELFSAWISNQEAQGLGGAGFPHHSRQVSGRISNEINTAPRQQHIASQQPLPEQQGLRVNSFFADDVFGDRLMQRIEGWDKASVAPDLTMLQALPWSQQCPPMTRSRSAELRRMYAAMQGLPALPSTDISQCVGTEDSCGLNQAVASLSACARNLANGHMPQPSQAILYPQSTYTFCPVGSGKSISIEVNMLKGSLERKKLNDMNKQVQHPVVGVASPWMPPSQPETSQTISAPLRSPSTEVVAQNAGQISLRSATSNGHQQSLVPAPAPSRSESSGGAPNISAGLTISDEPANSETVSTHPKAFKRTMHRTRIVDQPSKKLHHGDNMSSPGSHRSGDGSFEGYVNTIVGKKPERLTRAGSLISSGRTGLGFGTSNPTKMRRVERREKMLEAKGRPAIPSDLQVAVKRCDALEKEVRSLKLTVSFMNRKDSEQTKRIEELENENQELQEEKVRLLEELEQLASGHTY